MQKTITPDNRDTSIHGELSEQGFANIAKASPVIDSVTELEKFSRGLDLAGSNRSEDRARYVDGRHQLNLGRKVALGLLTIATATNPAVKEAAGNVIDLVKGDEATKIIESTPSDMNENPATETITVQPGDTVWGIADARTDGDVRPLVDEIMKQPDAQDGLQLGDKLEVPTTQG